MANFLNLWDNRDMNIPILQIPKQIQELCQNYKSNFSIPQFKNFENFITGIIINDQADIYALSKGFEQGKHYDSLHHFASESYWNMEDVLKTSISIIKHLPDQSKRLNSKGWLIIDDSLIEKFGKLMEAVSTQYDHSQNRYLKYAHCLVALVYTDQNMNRYPLNFGLWRSKQDCKEIKQKFLTKIEIARDLIQYAIDQGIPFQGVLFDSWYFCKDLVDFIESHNKDWVSASKSNRNIVHQGETINLQEYSKTINNNERRDLPKFIAKKEKVCRFKSIKKSMPCLKRGKETVRILVSYEYDKNKKFTKEPIFLVSNRKNLRPEKLLQIYQIRWAVETFFRDAKQHLGLEDYQMRKLKGIKSHWCLVFTSAVILELVKAKCVSKDFPINASHLSVGELCQRAFNEAFQAIIIWVIQQVKKLSPDHQIFSYLGIQL